MQAENPKQQYLLLRALNEVITSLTGDATLPDRQQDEVSLHHLYHLLPAHMSSLVGLAFAPINELSLACDFMLLLCVMSHHCAQHTPKPEDCKMTPSCAHVSISICTYHVSSRLLRH